MKKKGRLVLLVTILLAVLFAKTYLFDCNKCF